MYPMEFESREEAEGRASRYVGWVDVRVIEPQPALYMVEVVSSDTEEPRILCDDGRTYWKSLCCGFSPRRLNPGQESPYV